MRTRGEKGDASCCFFSVKGFGARGFSGHYLSLKPGERRNLGPVVVYRADKIVTGQVVFTAGKPPTPSLLVTLRGAHLQEQQTLDTSKQFRFVDATDEPLTLGIYGSQNNGFRTGANSPDLLAQMPVRAGQENVRLVVSKSNP